MHEKAAQIIIYIQTLQSLVQAPKVTRHLDILVIVYIKGSYNINMVAVLNTSLDINTINYILVL